MSPAIDFHSSEIEQEVKSCRMKGKVVTITYLVRVEMSGHGLAAVGEVPQLVDVEPVLARGQTRQVSYIEGIHIFWGEYLKSYYFLGDFSFEKKYAILKQCL